jgi:hypothetical protein
LDILAGNLAEKRGADNNYFPTGFAVEFVVTFAGKRVKCEKGAARKKRYGNLLRKA